MNYISHKVLYTMLPKIIRSMPSMELDNWIIQCVREIKSSAMYERKLAYTVVKDGKASLPKDMVRMGSVHYKCKELTAENLKEFEGCFDVGEVTDCAPDIEILGGTTEVEDSSATYTLNDIEEWHNAYHLFSVQSYENDGEGEELLVARNFAINSYLTTKCYKDCWIPLSLSKNIFDTCYVDKNSPNWISDCPYKYNLTKCHQLITTLPDGVIQIIYTGRLIDDEGAYLIPDDMDYLNVLKDGVLMKYFEEEYVGHTEGSRVPHREYKHDYYRGIAYLRGKQFYMNTLQKDKRMRNIIYAQINIANSYDLGNSAYPVVPGSPHMRLNQ